MSGERDPSQVEAQGASDSQALLPDTTACLWWTHGVITIFVISFLLGAGTGCTSAIIPGLQQETYGNNTFVWVGALSGSSGVLSMVYTPIMGSLSDERSRFVILVSVLSLCMVPTAVMLLFRSYYVYAFVNVFFGLANLVLVLLVIVITSKVPQLEKGRTLALSTNVAAFLLGVGGFSFVGPYLAQEIAFAVQLGMQALCVVATIVFLRKAIDKPNEDFVLPPPDESEGPPEQPRCPLRLPGTSPAVLDKDAPQPRCPLRLTESSPLVIQQEVEEEPLLEGEQTTTNRRRSAVASFVATLALHVRRSWRLLLKNSNIRMLVLISFFNYLTADMFDSVLLLYLQDSLHFTDKEVLYTIVIMAVSSVLFVFFVAATRSCMSDVNLLRIALASSTLMTVLYALVRAKMVAMWLPVVNVLGMAAIPATSVLTMASVAPGDIGVGKGVTAAARVGASAVCPFIYSTLFQTAQMTVLPGFPFLIAAACILVAFSLTFFLKFPAAAAEEKTEK